MDMFVSVFTLHFLVVFSSGLVFQDFFPRDNGPVMVVPTNRL